MRYFLKRSEYLFGVTADLSFASFEMAKDIAAIWSNAPNSEPGFRARQRMLNRLADYFRAEYDRRVRRHAFYEDLGYGWEGHGRSLSVYRRADRQAPGQLAIRRTKRADRKGHIGRQQCLSRTT